MTTWVRNLCWAALLALPLVTSLEARGAVTVTSFGAYTPTPAADQWYYSDSRTGTTGSTASIVDLTGAGGNLETNQPLPTGAARLTTDFTNPSMAEVGYVHGFGTVANVFNSGLQLSYNYYKQFNPNPGPGEAYNAAAAPSIKLTFFNAAYQAAAPGNDGFVTLIYEPYLNPLGNPPTDAWQSVSNIDLNNGLFWGNGGFGQPNGAGGPPLLTLSQWQAAFNSTSGGAFNVADLVAVKIGIGSYNPGQIDYFDNVHIAAGLFNQTFDFEAPSVPEPASLAIWGIASVLGCGYLRRRRS